MTEPDQPARDREVQPENGPRHRPGDAIGLGVGAWVDPSEVAWSFSRSGGPGGQHVNKTSTRAELRVAVRAIGGMPPDAIDRLRERAGHLLLQSRDEIRVVSDEHRSQRRNREACLERLSALVENPRTFVPGSRMAFAGIPDAGDRADLIAYLETQS